MSEKTKRNIEKESERETESERDPYNVMMLLIL